MELITAAHVQDTLAGIRVPGPRLRAVSYVFASEDDEAVFMATASEDDVIAYASAIAIAEDGSVNKESAKKFAKNRGFLSGLMHKIWTKLKSPAGVLKLGAIAGAIALVGTALTFACKNPAQFGAISQKFAAKASAWASQVGQLASRAIANAKKSGGAVKGFVANKLAAVVAKLKSLPGLLTSAAATGKQHAAQLANKAGQIAHKAGQQASQIGKQVQHQARVGALRGGAALHKAGQAVQQGTNKASNAVFKAGLNAENKSAGIGRAIQRGSGLVQRAGQSGARALKSAGTGVIKQAIPG